MSRVHVQGDLRADKIQYPDGVGCCIWYPLEKDGEILEDAGVCFDFRAEDILSMLWLLLKLLFARPDVFEDEDEPEEDEE